MIYSAQLCILWSTTVAVILETHLSYFLWLYNHQNHLIFFLVIQEDSISQPFLNLGGTN